MSKLFCLVPALAALASGCAPVVMAVPPSLSASSRLPLEGEFSGKSMRFGDYRAVDIDRGWVSTSKEASTTTILSFSFSSSESKQNLSFRLEAPEQRHIAVSCRVFSTSKEKRSGGTTLRSTSAALTCDLGSPPAASAGHLEVLFEGPVIKQGKLDLQKGTQPVESVYDLQGGYRMFHPAGFRIGPPEEALAAVQTMNDRNVWLSASSPPDEIVAAAAAAVALVLFYQDNR